MKLLHYTILATVGGMFASAGITLPQFAFLAPLGGILFFGGLAVVIGAVGFPEERPGLRAAFGILGALALVASLGAAVYYAYRLDPAALAGIFILSPWIPFACSAFRKPAAAARTPLVETDRPGPIDATSILLLLAVIIADAAALRWLVGAATAEPIRTPWETVPSIFFLWIFLGTAALIALALRGRLHHLTLAAASLHLFAILSPALLVYAIGFGFDPFIHIATERLIATAGEVTPKPPYYLGQYALVVALSKLFPIGVETMDRLLLPVLSAVFLPLGAVYALRRGFLLDRRASILAALGVFVMPLASFVATTPQGLANLFAVLLALFAASWTHDHRPRLPYLALIALAAAAIHPIAGVPALCYLLIAMLFRLRPAATAAGRTAKGALGIALVAATAFALPALFLLAEGQAPVALFGRLLSLPTAVWQWLGSLPAPETLLPTRFRPVLDFAEAAIRARVPILIAFGAGGILILWKRPGYRKTAATVMAFAAALSVSAMMLASGFVFSGVIAYEQSNYAARVFELALLMLLPAVLAAAAWWWRKLDRTDGAVRVVHVLLFAAVATAMAYANFPRDDAYVLGRGRATSIHDLRAVRSIDERADRPYVVLSNQAVSAAALRAFGFRTYYGDQYFYAIPTGAPLYSAYLKMVYDAASRDTMERAMDLVDVDLAYFVLNDYWTDAPRVIAEAKTTADGWWAVDDDRLHVFEYRR